jgi:UDP-2-acetamido-3-amino-2,3-dideoxy-glucuronate N-acetyltransferase
MPVAKDVQHGRDVRMFHPDLVNLYGCVVGDETRIGTFVEIQAGAKIGSRCKISSHTFICEGVTIEDEVFIGHGVMFTNDRFPRATTEDGRRALHLQSSFSLPRRMLHQLHGSKMLWPGANMNIPA